MTVIGIFGAAAGLITAILGLAILWTLIENRKNPILPGLIGVTAIMLAGTIVLLVVDLVLNLQNSIAGKIGMAFFRLLCPNCGF